MKKTYLDKILKAHLFWYMLSINITLKRKTKELLEQYYKSALCEYHLNSLAKP